VIAAFFLHLRDTNSPIVNRRESVRDDRVLRHEDRGRFRRARREALVSKARNAVGNSRRGRPVIDRHRR